MTRSAPENGSRANSAFETQTLDVPGVATETGVSVAPSGRWISSCCAHPVFWKSLMRTASLRGRDDRLRTLCAYRNAGP